MTPGWDWTRYAVAGATRPDSFTGMRPEFSDALAAMFSAAPADIRDELRVSSGYRSPERQAEIYRDALAKYGSEAEARQWAAPPGKSNHNRGVAADLSFLSPAARAWVHDNAQTYGLAFPLRNEPWHVELAGVRGEPLAYAGDEKPVSGAQAAITQALAFRGNPTTNEGSMIDMSKWRSNDLANALLARSMQTQAGSPVEAFSQIAQALMARKATERNDASNNSLLAQALMGSDLPESSRAAVMTSGNPNTLVQALLQNEQAKAAAAQHQADMAWKMDERQYQRGRDAMSDQRYAAEHAPYRTISAEEAGQMGLPAGQAYQVGPDGRLATIAGTARGGGGTGLQPIYGRDPNGNVVLGQLSQNGEFIATKMPEGVMPLGPYDTAQARAAGGAYGRSVGQAQAEAPSAMVDAERIARQIDTVLIDPALAGNVGSFDSMLPNWSQGSKDFHAKLDQLRGAAFLQGRQLLKGGGAITDVESAKAESAIARLSTAQSEKAFIDALNEFKAAVTDGAKKIQNLANGGAATSPDMGQPGTGAKKPLQPGDVLNGYQFLGGDPSDEKNWRPFT